MEANHFGIEFVKDRRASWHGAWHMLDQIGQNSFDWSVVVMAVKPVEFQENGGHFFVEGVFRHQAIGFLDKKGAFFLFFGLLSSFKKMKCLLLRRGS